MKWWGIPALGKVGPWDGYGWQELRRLSRGEAALRATKLVGTPTLSQRTRQGWGTLAEDSGCSEAPVIVHRTDANLGAKL